MINAPILPPSHNNSLISIFFSQNNCHFSKSILVNDINFTIEINIINHYLNNRAHPLNDYNLKTEGVLNKDI